LADPIQCKDGRYKIPERPGLGIEWNERLGTLCSVI
jgi:L-alanine-DL-glutamate epimerase-like enolase superfamily enzyme